MHSMIESVTELVQRLPDYLGGHMLLSISALAVGLAISVPLGILASRRPKLAETLLGAAGILQTVPTLALLVLMVPLLGGLIGFWPAFVALTLYSILPILANTVAGIRGVDRVVVEAARGLGMSDRQILRRVQLPLAAPVIIAGIRTATVLVVGTATLATPVGGASLGNYIFAGLEMNNMVSTVFGCIIAAALAVGLDQLVRLLQVAARRRSGRLAAVACIALFLVIAGGLYGPVTRLFAPPAPVVASAPFTEQHILCEVLAGKLHAAGFRVDQRQSMGETIQFLALRHNQVDCCVNYTGNVWATLMQRKDVQNPQTTFEETTRFLRERYGIVCLGRLGFENAYALAMTRSRAEQLGIRSIADLRRHAPRFRIAGDLQFFERGEWTRVRSQYGLAFREVRPMDATLMYQAVADGSVDVICAYTSDGRVLEKDLVILDDPAQAFPPYDAVLLLSAKAARDPHLRRALEPLVGAIDMTTIRRANLRVDVEGQPPRAAAARLLAMLGSG
jgi:osmoprotectant transport system permease protein